MTHPRDERGPGPVQISVPMAAVLARLGIDVSPPDHASPATPPESSAPARRTPHAAPDPLWSMNDISTYLSVDRRTVERLRASGKFPAPTLVVGRLPRWSPRTVRDWAENGGGRG